MSFKTLLRQTSEIPTNIPNKSLPTNIVSVIAIYFMQLAIMHRIFAEIIVFQTPNFVRRIPPINEPKEIPKIPFNVFIVIKFM